MGTGRVRGDRLSGRRFPFSLQTRILLVVLVCVVVPLLLMGAYLMEQTEAVLGARARETVTNQLHRRVGEVDAWSQERMREAVSWSGSFIVYEGVESLQKPGSDAARHRQDIKGYLEFVLGHDEVYESLFVVDLDGRVLASTREEEDLFPWDSDLLRQTRGTGGVMPPPRYSERLNRPTMLVVHDIQQRADKSSEAVGPASSRVIGYFVGRINLPHLASVLSTRSGEDEPSFSMGRDASSWTRGPSRTTRARARSRPRSPRSWGRRRRRTWPGWATPCTASASWPTPWAGSWPSPCRPRARTSLSRSRARGSSRPASPR
jgi:hypothetical protein